MKPLILYHGNCSDGFCSAWAVHTKLKDNAEYVPVFHGQGLPDVTDRDVYMLDFSVKRAGMDDVYARCKSITVLDHHKTAKEELARFGGEKATVVFDMEKSGGRLTWEHFHPDEPAHWVVNYTEDRDLWRWKLSKSEEINASLSSYPKEFGVWNMLCDHVTPDFLVGPGEAILRHKNQLVRELVDNAYEAELAGHKIMVCNAPILQSEVGAILAQDRPFSACFSRKADGAYSFSLRSKGDFDVSEIAKTFGGGGHKSAAGFAVSDFIVV